MALQKQSQGNVLVSNCGGDNVENNQLGPAYHCLLQTGLYHDLTIEINGEHLKAHKCVLAARSEKFSVMLLADSINSFREQSTNKMVVNNDMLSAKTFKAMLQWIYTGECEMSDNSMEILTLLALTDEYLLPDL